MQNIYCLSGLGADERIFRKLTIPGYKLVHIPWVPHSGNDTMESYAAKLAVQIKDPAPLVMGLSFGGMMAVEIGRLLPTRKIIIISSAKNRGELPQYNTLFSALISLMPSWFYTQPLPPLLERFGAKTTEEKELMKQIIKDSDGGFMKWALSTMQHWRKETTEPNILHIHGTDDDIIPAAGVRPTFWLQGGTHIMVYNRAQEISNIILENIGGTALTKQ
ncbi:MAG: alpha/beta hydrolase [Taibaiella sp.]|nr:alpha/beta hydrolase [Taibaiella sp.]